MAKRNKLAVISGVDSISVNFADNGYVVEYSGQDENDDWANAKLVVNTVQEVIDILKDVAENRR
jgi:hypothetical protein